MKLTTKQWIILWSIFLVILFLSVCVRYTQTSYPPLEGSYYPLKIARALDQQFAISEDPLSDQPFIFDTYYWVLFVLAKLIGPQQAIILLPLILSAMNFLLVSLLLLKTKLRSQVILYTLFAYLLATPLIYGILVADLALFYLFLTLLVLNLLQNKASIDQYFAFGLALPLLFSQWYLMLSYLFILGALYYHNKKHKAFFFWSSVVAAIFQLPILLSFGLPKTNLFSSGTLLEQYITNLGGWLGFDILYLALMGVGIVISWRNKKTHYPLYGLFLVLFVLSLIYPPLILFLHPLAAFFAAKGFLKLSKSKWKLQVIKKLTLSIIIIGISVTLLLFIVRIGSAEPTNTFIRGLLPLQEQDRGIVLTHPSDGLYTQYFGAQPTVLDSQSWYKFNQDELWNQTQEIFNSYQLDHTKSILDELDVSYLLITDSMKQGGVWEDPEEGLLFLLRNNETFKRISTSPEVEIWQYLR